MGQGRRVTRERQVSRGQAIGTRIGTGRPIAGRDDLLELAERRLGEAAAGKGQFLLLAGEAGVGKSRLMSAVETRARGANFRSASGLLAPQDSDVPAALLLDMARSMTRVEQWSDLGRQFLDLADALVEDRVPVDEIPGLGRWFVRPRVGR
jgi:hypothetical protein